MQRLTDLILSFLLTLASFLLSWPFWRDFEYWAESHLAWWIYFVSGFVLGVYVFYVFIGSLRILFTHAQDEALARTSGENDNDNEGGRA